ncbi:tyrosine-type recombinase/integrase [Kangiella sp. TOML190]|uniref:tyrosine-type recombinase/integrase n=1 Tax=Kangiella sp. TOML190 TaxID=2931351 RepID=UPI00203DE309|nr:tyrosine-type recombinase/integrase [Kangiella sp. TOML190]
MPLTDIKVKGIKPQGKDQWFSDERGLRLLVKPNGSKYWRLKYRFSGKQKTLALGVYPTITLKMARELTLDAKRLIAKGVDPSLQKKEQKLKLKFDETNSFSQLAKEWWDKSREEWSEGHANKLWRRLKLNSFSSIGHLPVDQITPQDIIQIVKKIEKRDALDVARKVLQDISRVCRYAVQMGRLTVNPASDLTDIIKTRKLSHRPSLPREELPRFLKDLEQYHLIGRKLTQLAIKLLVLTFVRPGELRGALWSEFDFDEMLWRIPGERMKMSTEHLVPLSRQSISVLNEIKVITGQHKLVFPSERRRIDPMSDNTMRKAIFSMGYDGKNKGKSKATPHGFRATASSILNEEGFNSDAIERQLSHLERNSVRAAYTHHAKYLDERREMMQWWADYLYKE